MPRKAETKVGYEIARRREAKGWTQQELADAAELSQPYVSQVEAGTREPSLSVLRDLAKALGVTVDDLLREPEGPAST